MISFRPFLISLFIVCWVFLEPAQSDESTSRTSAHKDPWFTGTLLSTRGSTVEKGRMVVEPFFYVTRFGGLYNNNWRLQSETTSSTNVLQNYIIYGLTDNIDFEIAPQWLASYSGNESSSGFGDLPLQLGLQIMKGTPWFMAPGCSHLGSGNVSDRKL